MWISEGIYCATLPNKNDKYRTMWKFGTLTTNLCKNFGCFHHELFIAKIDMHGFHIKSIKLIQQKLPNRKLKIKVGDAYSS